MKRRTISVRHVRAAAAAMLAVAGAGCHAKRVDLPSPLSPSPVARPDTAGLRAGFARVDITPPPGPSTLGYGPEGRAGRGWRGRLYARAMVLEDAGGERLAIVSADLDLASVPLHRLAAERTLATSGIGADRLLLTATHTHSGPGHYLGVPSVDAFGGAVAGFDPDLVEFLATRIARTVELASADMRPARAAWSVHTLWKATRIRSYPASRLDVPVFQSPDTIPGMLDREKAVDPTWRMLRVDAWDPAARAFRPRGAWTIFPIHGTAVPAGADLFDADIHEIVSRRVELHVDSANLRPRGLDRWAVHLFSNGPEGDVSPNVDRASRCPAAEIRRVHRVTGPRTPMQPDRYEAPFDTTLWRCVGRGRQQADSLGGVMGDSAVRWFDAMAARMEEPAARRLRIARAFEVVRMYGGVDSLCPYPLAGTGAVSGAEDGRSRIYRWKLLGFLGRGFGVPADSARPNPAHGCHAEKHVALGGLQHVLMGARGLPQEAQLSVVRVGGMVIGTLPAEPTTNVGVRIRTALAAATGAAMDSVTVLAHTNGYLQYVATREEYSVPNYEGGATEYGPHEAAFFQRELARIAGRLPPAGMPSPPDSVARVAGWYLSTKQTFAGRRAGPSPVVLQRRVVGARWVNDSVLVVRWIDLAPGRLVPADGPVLAIERRDAAGWSFVTSDDDHQVEVRHLCAADHGAAEWEARWMPSPRPAGDYRVVLLPRAELPAVTAEPGTATGHSCAPWPR